MPEIETIQSALRRTARRLRWLRGWEGFWRGAVVGASAYLTALALFKVLPVPHAVVLWSGLAALLAAVVGFLVGFRRPTSEIEAARWLDEREGLQQRLATALEVSGRELPDTWKTLVVTDAAAIAQGVQPERLLPVRLPRLSRVLVSVLVVIVALGFVPEYRSKAHVQQQADAAVIQEVGRQLTTLTRRSLEQRPPAAEPVRKRQEEVQELGQRLTQAKLTRDDALKDLAKTTEQLRQQASELSRNPALRRMEKAARTPGGQSPPSQASLQKQLDALQKQLGDKSVSPEAADQLRQQMDQLKEAAKGLADNSGGNPEALQQKLASMASDLARKAEAMGMPLPDLDDAVAALQSSQIDQFLKDLESADRDLEKLADLARQMAQLQQQAQKLGKDLAEQLKNGQGEAAVDSLRRMQELLKQPGLTSEQLQQLQDEVTKAIQPADQYGKVGEHLKKALSQSKSGQKQDAQQSLAAAQKELEDLMKQMGDMEGLMASLANLQKAQMCIGNCQGWGKGAGRVGFNPNGTKGGKGFGTWAQDNPWALPNEIQDLWDNSGINRPDMASKGQTERDATVDGGLAPTKIKGQMQPGGPMPSITLKGLSIKGESKVAYTEAVTAAQSEAQAALTQEQVPKAYRNSVRDYFDDLKQ